MPGMNRRLLPAVLSLLIAFQPAFLSAAEASKPGPNEAPSKPLAEYKISAGDVVSIVVYPVDEYSKEVTVQPDGAVELSLLGAILVKGLTAHELQTLLEQKYSRFVANPKVTVNVRRFSGRRVAIIGEIRNPGYYEYRDGLRMLELVAMAGGLTDQAKANHAKVLRQTETSLEHYEINIAKILEGKTDRNPAVNPGDTIYVPKGRITRNAIWVNTNILPWLSLATLISSLVLVVKD
jgi:polysaccharide biosynthesis/export protein